MWWGVPADLSASMHQQARQALASIDQSLRTMGLSKENIALVTVYLADMVQKAEMNRAGDEWASSENPPVRACVGSRGAWWRWWSQRRRTAAEVGAAIRVAHSITSRTPRITGTQLPPMNVAAT